MKNYTNEDKTLISDRAVKESEEEIYLFNTLTRY